ncbi:MAG: N(1)-aminopropylagmatine ureohydrolase [Planctomycetes bacterium ADurb.Bin412]|nr:MAG: N(1)-aminopropylagmatine ureohydrolase [Planctomycetes bacterium ADurb.Bin412]
MKSQPVNAFLDLPMAYAQLTGSRFVILPIRYDGSVSYKRGAGLAPDAIIEASKEIETFDEQLAGEFFQAGIHTHPGIDGTNFSPEQIQEEIYTTVLPLLEMGKVPISLGGDHSVTPALVKAAKQARPNLSVLHIDAHGDFRDRYLGSPWSHASIMRRIYDMGIPSISLGIRSICREQYDFIRDHDIAILPPEAVEKDTDGAIAKILSRLTDEVYITLDIDGFDPAIAPGTAIPEPGGLSYYPVLRILEAVGRFRQIVAADIVEVMPIPNNYVTEFLAARLAYKIITFAQLR